METKRLDWKMKKRYTYEIETQTDGWVTFSSACLCVHLSPLLWPAILSLFFFTMFCDPGVMLISCLGSTHDAVSAGRLLWITYVVIIHCKMLCSFLPVTTTTQIAQEVVVALIPPFLRLSCSLMHTCCSLCCFLSCVYVVAHHVICLHELCISYYLQLFNSSKLSWCLTAPPQCLKWIVTFLSQMGVK